MAKWILKAVVQKGISLLPLSHRLNFLFQKYITRGVFLTDAYTEDKLIHFLKHRDFVKPENARLLELGTGWYPLIPLFYYLEGAESVVSIDLNPLATDAGIRTTAQQLIAWKSAGRLKALSVNDPHRWKQIETLGTSPDPHQQLKSMNISLLLADARHTSFPSESFTGIVSNNTLEHVFPEAMESIFREFNRLLPAGGRMSHFIDMSDHFAHLDSGISIYNFLRFSSMQWKWIDNDVQPQNRLRIPQYRDVFEKTGFKILKELLRAGSVEAIRNLKIHPEWSRFSIEELAVSHAYCFMEKTNV